MGQCAGSSEQNAAWLANVAGWRYAMAPGAAICLACFVLVLVVVRDHPADVNLPAYGETEIVPLLPRHAQQNAIVTSFSCLATVSSNRTFLILAGTFFVCGLSTSGLVQNHFVPLCNDHGIPSMTSSSLLAMMGGLNFIGTILSGWLTDRYDNRWLLFWYYASATLTLLTGLSPNWWVLLTMRAATGIALAIVADYTDWRLALGATGTAGLASAIGFRLLAPLSHAFEPARRNATEILAATKHLMTDRALPLLYAEGFLLMGALYHLLRRSRFRCGWPSCPRSERDVSACSECARPPDQVPPYTSA